MKRIIDFIGEPYPRAVLGAIVWLAGEVLLLPLAGGLRVQVVGGLLVALVVVGTGAQHGYFYARLKMFSLRTPKELGLNKVFNSWMINNMDVHRTQTYIEYSTFVLAILVGVSPLIVLGSQYLARVPFQGFINLGVGRPFIDPEEPKFYTVSFPGGTRRVRKFLPGTWSYVKPVLGLALIGLSLYI